MFSATTETYVAWVTWLLFLASGLAGLAGLLTLGGARRMRYFQVRREAILRGWGRLFAGVILFFAALLAMAFGTPVMHLALRDTPSPRSVAAASLIAPTFTAAPDSTRTAEESLAALTQAPSATTNTPGPSATPSQTGTPTTTPTPALPVAFITPILTATVTPPAQATAADVRFSLKNDCAVPDSQAFFDQTPKQIYAHFFYDSWLPGVEWSGVWLRNGSVVFVETHLWDGSTGGCGYSNYDNAKNWWDEGSYEVQIFVGDRWLVSNHFQVVRTTPAPTATDSATPRPPTASPTPVTPTDTPMPSDTPTITDTPTPSGTPTATPTRTPRPPTATPSTPPTATATIYPPGVTALATIELASGMTTYVLRATPPDGQVVVFVQSGTPVEVLTGYQLIDGVLWRQVRLSNGVEGWIQNFFLQFTSPS